MLPVISVNEQVLETFTEPYILESVRSTASALDEDLGLLEMIQVVLI